MTVHEPPPACTTREGKPKRGFAGRRAAEHAARISRSESGQPARVYRCRLHGWHVTTTELLWWLEPAE